MAEPFCVSSRATNLFPRVKTSSTTLMVEEMDCPSARRISKTRSKTQIMTKWKYAKIGKQRRFGGITKVRLFYS